MKWVKMGWGDDFLDERLPGLKYNVSFKNAVYSDSTPLEISKRVIEEISQTYPPPYTLMCSGGIDSQTMLWFWHNSGVPFRVLSVVYKNSDDGTNFNDHDLEQLKEFADRYQIPVQYKDFDIINFLENDLVTYATKYECTSPQITAHMAMSEGIDGTVIFSGNFRKHVDYTYTVLGLKRYADISKRNFIPYFLLHDKELAVSIDKYITSAKQPDVSKILDKHERNAAHYKNRVDLLQYAQIPVISQPNKLTGFEIIKNYYDEKSKRLNLIPWMERIKYKMFNSKRAFDILFRYRLTEIIKYEDLVRFSND